MTMTKTHIMPGAMLREQYPESVGGTRQHEVLSEQEKWHIPPVPPIPEEMKEMTWKRRSLKRDSYILTSHNIAPANRPSRPISTKVDDISTGWAKASLRPQSTYHPITERKKRPRTPGVDKNTVTWDEHPANPRHWSPTIKWLHTIAALTGAFTVSLASSINASAYVDYAEQYQISSVASVLPYSLFLLGLASGSLTGCVRFLTGRKVVTCLALVFFAIFTIISAFVKDFAAVAITRCFAGVAASTLLSCAPAILLDLYAAGRRTLPLVLYSTTFPVGIVLGSYVGNVIEEHLSVVWPLYIVLMCIAVSLTANLCIRETAHEVLTASHTHGADRSKHEGMVITIDRQFRIIGRERSVLLSALSIAFISAVAFALLQVLPKVLQETYDFDRTGQACMLLSLLCGCLIALTVLALHCLCIYMPKRRAWEQDFEIAWEKYDSRKSRSKRRASRKSIHLSSHLGSTPSQQRLTSQSSETILAAHMSPGLAVAIATEVNSLPSTTGTFVSAEAVWHISNQYVIFEDTLGELEKRYHVALDREKMRQLWQSWTAGSRTSEVLTAPCLPPELDTFNVNDQREHRAATLAALEDGSGQPDVDKARDWRKAPRSLFSEGPLMARQRPPPEWRLTPSIPGSVLSTSGLFLLAWTTSRSIHWIAPALGLATFGCGGSLVAMSICLYLSDKLGSEDTVHALSIITSASFGMAFVFVMASVPIFSHLTSAWAITVLAFCSLGVWVGPLGLRHAV